MASKQADLIVQLRQDIVNGRFRPGGRIPPQTELAERFGVAGMTIQMVLKHLEREGFIEARGRTGTFVVEAPPHLSRVALVFQQDPTMRGAWEYWSRYFQALTQAAVRFQERSGRRVLMFHGVGQHTDSEDRDRLIAYLETHQVAGVIFANNPFELENTPILDLPGIPRVAIQSEQQYPQVQALSWDRSGWQDKALDYFAALGRRRVAWLDFGMAGPDDKRLDAGLAARGMVSHRRWRQFVSLRKPESASRIVELMMRDTERPEALLVTDDNFLEQALAGLIIAGIKVPDEVAVVGHANFPMAPTKTVPARLLGYDAELALAMGVDLIDRQRRGEPVPGKVMIPAQWEEEVGVVGGGRLKVEGGSRAGSPRRPSGRLGGEEAAVPEVRPYWGTEAGRVEGGRVAVEVSAQAEGQT